jgi:hypothetical protein
LDSTTGDFISSVTAFDSVFSKGFILLTSSPTAHTWYFKNEGVSLLQTILAHSPTTILATFHFTAVVSFWTQGILLITSVPALTHFHTTLKVTVVAFSTAL